MSDEDTDQSSRKQFWRKIVDRVVTVLLALITYESCAAVWENKPAAVVAAVVLWTKT